MQHFMQCTGLRKLTSWGGLFLGLSLSLSGGLGCQSSEEVQTIDTAVEVKGQVDDKKLGLNDDGEAILQREVDADDEFLIQQRLNLELESDLEHQRKQLETCSIDMADPRLGGDGEFPELDEPGARMSPGEIREEFGLNEDGQLKVVQRESFVKNLKVARKYEGRLRTLIDMTERHRRKCEMRMRTARVKAGLPADRYRAEGYFESGGRWIETRKAELSIDDAFEIKNAGSAHASPVRHRDSDDSRQEL